MVTPGDARNKNKVLAMNPIPSCDCTCIIIMRTSLKVRSAVSYRDENTQEILGQAHICVHNVTWALEWILVDIGDRAADERVKAIGASGGF